MKKKLLLKIKQLINNVNYQPLKFNNFIIATYSIPEDYFKRNLCFKIVKISFKISKTYCFKFIEIEINFINFN